MPPEQIALFRVVLDEILREDATCDAKNGGVDVISALNATQIWTVRASHHHSFRHTSAFIQIKSNQIKSNHALTNRIESRGTQGATQGATQGGEGGATQLTQAQTKAAEEAAAVRLLPIRPRSRCERRSLRTFPVVTLHPRFPFNV
jgi:hypothetical protein